MHNSRLGGGRGTAFWAEDIKEVLERMQKGPWDCNLWLPLPAPLGRLCYMETGWDGRGGPGVQVSSPTTSPGRAEKSEHEGTSPQLLSRSRPSGRELPPPI